MIVKTFNKSNLFLIQLYNSHYQDHFSSYEKGHLVDGEKQEDPREKPPETPASRTWIVLHSQVRVSNPHQTKRRDN